MTPDNSPSTEFAAAAKLPDAAFAKPLAAMKQLSAALSEKLPLTAAIRVADVEEGERYVNKSAIGPFGGWDETVAKARGAGEGAVYASRLRVSFSDAVTGRAGEDKIWNNYHLLSGTPSWEILHKGDMFYDDRDPVFMKKFAVLWVDVKTAADGKTEFTVSPEKPEEMPGRFGINYPGRIFGAHTFWSYYGLKPNAGNGFSCKTYTSGDGTLPQALVSDFRAFYEAGTRRNIFAAPKGPG